ncbi:MAG: hypothetical protein WBE92_03095 [Steroidobacteraceae bacterium]
MPRRRRPASCGLSWLVIASVLGTAALPPVVAAGGSSQQAKPPADDCDLMEFLGGIGSADQRWIDYLAKTDPAKVASPTKLPPPPGGDGSDGSSGGSQKK